MPKEKTIFDPDTVLPKVKMARAYLYRVFSSKKRIAAAILLLLIVVFASLRIVSKRNIQTLPTASLSQNIEKNFEFTALSNQGKPLPNKIKFNLSSVEKTNQVLVKDQTFTARNNKTFLIVHVDLKNDATVGVNIITGDLVRLTVDGDEENKFAPDLHNNLVFIAPISTKEDRLGFVIPENAKNFRLYIGELEGKKEEVSVKLPS